MTFLRGAFLATLTGFASSCSVFHSETPIPTLESTLEVVDAKAHVVIFITVDCPIANGYAPTIEKLAKEYRARGLRFFLVHVDPDVSTERARRHATEFGYSAPVLVDSTHTLVKKLEATHTPEAFVLKRNGSIAYRGRINDLYGDLGKKRPSPRKHDLRDALEAVASGKSVPVSRTEPVGCFIPEL